MPTPKSEPVSKVIGTNKLQPEITEDAIRTLAYQFYLDRTETNQDGSPDQDWYNAVTALTAEVELIERALSAN